MPLVGVAQLRHDDVQQHPLAFGDGIGVGERDRHHGLAARLVRPGTSVSRFRPRGVRAGPAVIRIVVERPHPCLVLGVLVEEQNRDLRVGAGRQARLPEFRPAHAVLHLVTTR